MFFQNLNPLTFSTVVELSLRNEIREQDYCLQSYKAECSLVVQKLLNHIKCRNIYTVSSNSKGCRAGRSITVHDIYFSILRKSKLVSSLMRFQTLLIVICARDALFFFLPLQLVKKVDIKSSLDIFSKNKCNTFLNMNSRSW